MGRIKGKSYDQIEAHPLDKYHQIRVSSRMKELLKDLPSYKIRKLLAKELGLKKGEY